MKLTREKHLDHMVRVVPVIVFMYAVQCYIISGMNTSIGGTTLFILGGLLSTMICGFITYDLKHVVKLEEKFITMTFLSHTTTISYADILEAKDVNPQTSFGSIVIKTSKTSHKFYFIDEPEKVLKFIEEKRTSTPEQKLAA